MAAFKDSKQPNIYTKQKINKVNKKNRNRTRNYLWILVPVVLLLILASSLTIRIIEKKRLQAIDASAKAETIFPIKVIEVKSRDISRFIRSSGVVRAWQKAILLSEVPGKVESISAKTGDPMSPGTPILKIDDEMLQYTLEQAKANVLHLEANMEISNKKFAREKNLYLNKVISELEFDIVVAKEKADRALLNSAKASLKIKQRDLRESLITSPIYGVLADRSVDIGTNVARGTMLATVVDIEKVIIKVGLSEKEITKIDEGQAVTIETDAYPGKTYAGSIYSVGTKADDFTLSFPVEVVVINNQDLILKPGMTARIAVKIGTYSDAFSLPQESIIKNKGQQYVWIADNQRAHKTTINPEDTIGSEVIIRDGLIPGQLVVVSGMEKLFENTPIEIIKK